MCETSHPHPFYNALVGRQCRHTLLHPVKHTHCAWCSCTCTYVQVNCLVYTCTVETGASLASEEV